MEPEIREVTQSGLAPLRDVWSVVYRRGEPVEPDVLGPDDRAFAAFHGSQVVGGWSEPLMNVSRGRARLKCAGVAGVGVLPEARVLGVGKAMMTWAIRRMHGEGYALASLYAFRESYYRKFGYEVAGRRWQLTAPQGILPRTKASGATHRIMPDQLDRLIPAYEAFASRVSGVNFRTAAQWQERMGKKAPMIYAVGDPVTAYAWVSMEGNFWEDLRVGEFVWTDLNSYEQMMGVLSGLCTNRSGLIWYEPSLSPFVASHLDHGLKMSLERSVMWRVVDVPRALAALRPESSGEFRIRVADDLLPENIGPWKVSFEPGEVHVEQTDSAELECDVRQFVQAIMGEPSFSELMKMNMVRASSDAAAGAASNLLAPCACCCLDFF